MAGKQVDVLNILKRKSWSGNTNTIYCPLRNGSKIFKGRPIGIDVIDETSYVAVKNEKTTVYIPEDQFIDALYEYSGGDISALKEALLKKSHTTVISYGGSYMGNTKDGSRKLFANLMEGDF